MARETEIKFRVADLRALGRKLRALKFRQVTRSTREFNTLYDLPGQTLRKRKELLRLRQYGSEWKLTHKSGSKVSRHSTRDELETGVKDGKTMEKILRALGYAPSFRYEKLRAEWTDHKGQLVIDQTPIGNYCELEGPPRWIDATAKKLGVSHSEYITRNYATLFSEWKQATKHKAEEMTFRALGRRKRSG